MDFTISGRAGGSTVVHDETLPARLVEEVHNACLFVEETVCWVFDGNEDSRILCYDVLDDIDDVDKEFIMCLGLIR